MGTNGAAIVNLQCIVIGKKRDTLRPSPEMSPLASAFYLVKFS